MINNQNYDPIENLFNSTSGIFLSNPHELSVSKDSDYDPIAMAITDDSLKSSFNLISTDLNNISQKNNDNMVFFKADVAEYDLFNLHPPGILRSTIFETFDTLPQEFEKVSHENLENLEK